MHNSRICALIAASIVLFAPPAAAHPAVAVVMDSRGNVFYSDLINVWRIGTDGYKSIAVPNVHTHELYVDAKDNLYGEHLWHDAEAKDTWRHRVWKRSPKGIVFTVVPPTEGFRSDYSFVRDAGGSMYWPLTGKAPYLMKKSAKGSVSIHARGPFREIHSITAATDGTLYLIDDGELKKISVDGIVHIMASKLAERSITRFNVSRQHSVMGLWLDHSNNIYAAIYGTGEVKKITPQGAVSVFAKSRFPWSPSGGAFAADGSLWLLEASITKAQRIRRIEPDGRVTTF